MIKLVKAWIKKNKIKKEMEKMNKKQKFKIWIRFQKGET